MKLNAQAYNALRSALTHYHEAQTNIDPDFECAPIHAVEETLQNQMDDQLRGKRVPGDTKLTFTLDAEGTAIAQLALGALAAKVEQMRAEADAGHPLGALLRRAADAAEQGAALVRAELAGGLN